ncbi:RecQ family ATP-dependent DNA helicase [Falsibacillus albus]|uniref:ATP-dependent DNA helicase RecQ n=1 Tax=Falsibacillus albus TaxID=2478915 RepID=A0A3L7JZE4_9BACI|nr:ATP-dependent DNA helicase RecQ [Falsibacillus albus]RLQ95061.1 ATP-dependent DNA helicase RecQ [Falsibacillus albus]
MILEQVLHKYFGYSSFRTGQKEIIQTVLAGKDTIAMLPTGTGKSLCYQLPGYLLKGSVLIISPLLSLMQDQVEQLKANGEKRVVGLNSFLTFDEKKHVLSTLKKYKFIYASPERLANPALMNKLKNMDISLFVIDEAHCISQWGHDFRPDYSGLGKVRMELGCPATMALTATATESVRKDIASSLKLKDAEEWIFSVDRKNIGIYVKELQSHQEKFDELLYLVKNLQGDGIIYFSSKKMAEEVSDWLGSCGIRNVAAYHGGMDQEQRILIQQQFLYGQLNIICATSAFGMGINKDNIRYVIHFHMPSRLESYIQEIGRAGRDGNPSAAIYLSAPHDEQLPMHLIDNEMPSESQIEGYSSMMNKAESENEIRQVLDLTETQARFLNHFFKSHSGQNEDIDLVEAAKGFCAERCRDKYEQLSIIQNWVSSKNCRREGILHFFNEELGQKPLLCCDRCGLDLSSYFHTEKNGIEEDSEMEWDLILRNILLGDVVEK